MHHSITTDGHTYRFPSLVLHRKGSLYILLGLACSHDSKTDTVLVQKAVYLSLERNTEWERPWDDFVKPFEWPDGVVRPRFFPVTGVIDIRCAIGTKPADISVPPLQHIRQTQLLHWQITTGVTACGRTDGCWTTNNLPYWVWEEKNNRHCRACVDQLLHWNNLCRAEGELQTVNPIIWTEKASNMRCPSCTRVLQPHTT